MTQIAMLAKQVLRPDEAMDLLRISRTTLYRMMASGEIPTLHGIRPYRIPSSAILRILAEAEEDETCA